MSELPSLTLVTVTYNAAHCVERTIRSVASQDYPKLEYLLIDGASTDGTLSIAQRYAARISRIVSEPDRGIYDAMNKGTRAAHGDWILFLNAGDCLARPDTLSRVFRTAPDPTCALLIGSHKQYSSSLALWRLFPPSCSAKNYSIRSTAPGNHQCTFFRTRILREFGYDLSFPIMADWECQQRILKAGHTYCITPEAVSWYDCEGVSARRDISYCLEQARIRGERPQWPRILNIVWRERARKLAMRLLPSAYVRRKRRAFYLGEGYTPLSDADKRYLLL